MYYYLPDLERSSLRTQSDEGLRRSIEHIADDWPVHGYRRVTHVLRRLGVPSNHNRVARILPLSGIAARPSRRIIANGSAVLEADTYPNRAVRKVMTVRAKS